MKYRARDSLMSAKNNRKIKKTKILTFFHLCFLFFFSFISFNISLSLTPLPSLYFKNNSVSSTSSSSNLSSPLVLSLSLSLTSYETNDKLFFFSISLPPLFFFDFFFDFFFNSIAFLLLPHTIYIYFLSDLKLNLQNYTSIISLEIRTIRFFFFLNLNLDDNFLDEIIGVFIFSV